MEGSRTLEIGRYISELCMYVKGSGRFSLLGTKRFFMHFDPFSPIQLVLNFALCLSDRHQSSKGGRLLCLTPFLIYEI